jgi:hypothetical protein
LVERKSFEVSVAASEQVDGRSQRFHSLKLSHWSSLKRSEGACARCAIPPKLDEKSDRPQAQRLALEAVILVLFRSIDGMMDIWG